MLAGRGKKVLQLKKHNKLTLCWWWFRAVFLLHSVWRGTFSWQSRWRVPFGIQSRPSFVPAQTAISIEIRFYFFIDERKCATRAKRKEVREETRKSRYNQNSIFELSLPAERDSRRDDLNSGNHYSRRDPSVKYTAKVGKIATSIEYKEIVCSVRKIGKIRWAGSASRHE